VRVARSLAVLSLLGPLFAYGEARAQEAKIVVLHQPALAAEEELLTESLRIYTRDLGCEVRVDGTAPGPLDPPALAQLQSDARAGGAEYVLWVGARAGGGATYYSLDVAPGELRETQVGLAGASSAAQEVALKVRALVSSRRRRAATPAPPAPEAARTPATPPAVADSSTDAGRTRPPPEAAPADARSEAPEPLERGASAEASVVARQATPPVAESPHRPPRFALDAGFGVTTPADRTWARSGLVVDLSGRVTSPKRSASVWIYAEGALTTHPSTIVRGFDVKVADVPVTAGALLRLRLSHGSVAVGSRSTLHVFDINADTPAGRAASTRKYALGLGGLARADATIAAHLGAFLQASVEGIVPNQEFTIGGQSAASTGGVLYGAVAGLSFTAP
jgi:hypothetical protein